MASRITTIKAAKSTVEILEKLKIHPRQPYEEVILSLLSKKIPKKFGLAKSRGGRMTTIKLRKKTVKMLEKVKVHPRQPYEEVILGLMQK